MIVQLLFIIYFLFLTLHQWRFEAISLRLDCMSCASDTCITMSFSGSSFQYCSHGLRMVHMLSNRQKAAVSVTHQLIQTSLEPPCHDIVKLVVSVTFLCLTFHWLLCRSSMTCLHLRSRTARSCS